MTKNNKKNIVLIGMMGSGKTTIGSAAAFLYGLKFIDTDEMIVSRVKVTIPVLFENYGEAYFRALEADTARQVASLTGAVIATGGGMVLAAENMRWLGAMGRIIYLRASAQTILKRVSACTDRPLLAEDMPAKIVQLLSSREALYQQYSDFIIDTDELTVEEAVSRLKEYI